jgi:hypothetical protein
MCVSHFMQCVLLASAEILFLSYNFVRYAFTRYVIPFSILSLLLVIPSDFQINFTQVSSPREYLFFILG